MSQETGDKQKQEQDGLDIDYQEKLKMYLDRHRTLEQNLPKAYALIYSTYCNKTMQNRIEEHPDFTTKLQDDPIELLKAIKVLMHDPIRAKYPYASLTEAVARIVNIKQMENEDLLDYVKRFKQARDITKSHVGTEILDTFVENTLEYKSITGANRKAEMKRDAFERWMAFLLIRNSDQAKYASLVNQLISQYSMGQDQYPKTITAATDVLNHHRWDKKSKPKTANSGNPRSTSNNDDVSTLSTSTATSFAQSAGRGRNRVCFCCGREGHIAPDCDNPRPREQWVHPNGIQHLQAERVSEVQSNSEVDDTGSVSSARSGRTGWSGLQVNFFHSAEVMKETYKNSILLDNGSTLSIFTNPELVENIKNSSQTLAMATNAGVRISNQEATVPEFGKVWYDEEAIANIFGLADLIKKGHRITFDSNIENAFIVHLPDKIVKFEATPEGLYRFEVPESYKESIKKNKNQAYGTSNLVDTVAENRKGYTQRQFERAKRARALYHTIGTPTVRNFKALLRMNVIQNCPVTVDDVNMAEKIFGPDKSSLKGKSTRKKPTVVKHDLVEIPKEVRIKHKELDLCMDTMFVNECGMLTAIDKSIRFRSLVPIDSKEHEEYFRALDVILRHYNNAGFVIRQIDCDGEYRAMMDQVSDDLDVKMNYTNAGDHVPEAERNNRTLKERIRATYHRLPYKAIPRLMIRYLAMVCTSQLNLFPAKGGVSSYYSPRMIVSQTNLDYNKHCRIPFGAYVLANHESNPTNTVATRALDVIYLRPNNANEQGGHELMDLNSGRFITRARVKVLPVTETVIKAVEAMAYKQGFQSLKFKNRHGVVFHDADWIAGVDYDDYQDDDQDDDQGNVDENDDDNDDDKDDQGYNNDDENVEEEGNDAEDSVGENNNNDDEVEDDHGVEAQDADNEISENEDDEEYHPEASQCDIDEAIQDGAEVSNPTEHEEETPPQVETVTEDEEPNIAPQESGPRRPRRSTKKTTLLSPNWHGKSYVQQEHRVSWKDLEERKLEYCHNLVDEVHPNPNDDAEYATCNAMLIARIMDDISNKVTMHGASFAQQYILQKGLKIFKEEGKAAALKEMDQLHRRNCFTPISIATLTTAERKKAVDALMFLSEKRDKSKKGRMVYNGKPTREWLSREDSASPTAAHESVQLTGVIDAREERDVMCGDVPNAFIQALIPNAEKDGNERVIMKITGVLVDMLVQLNPEMYGPYVVYENGRKVLYVQVLRALYGMLQAALLWYKKFRSELEEEGFKFNPYDPCVANRMRKGSQHTIVFHVDDIKSSHKLPKVNDDFAEWLQKKYGTHGAVAIHRGKKHDYLGMIFDYSEKGKLKIDMTSYVQDMIDEFPEELDPDEEVSSPSTDSLFKTGQSKKLDSSRSEKYHTLVAKGLFVSKRARPDIHPTIAVLCTRVKSPNEMDWMKLTRLIKYLKCTKDDILTLSAEDLRIIKWYVDASFAVHPDFKSHSGGIMTFGQGAVQVMSRKQKLNTRSSTESELVAADDHASLILWTKLFMEEQGYDIDKNILYQDNKSAILLEVNGKKSSGKRTRALNIRYFFLTNQVEKGNLSIEYCPTDEMIGDFMTKPLQGIKFKKFADAVMGR